MRDKPPPTLPAGHSFIREYVSTFGRNAVAGTPKRILDKLPTEVHKVCLEGGQFWTFPVFP